MRTDFGGQLREEVLRLCRKRYSCSAGGEALPQTLCNHHLWPRNSFDHDDHLVLLDWAFAGKGWVGSDIGNFVSDSALDPLRSAAGPLALDAGVFRAATCVAYERPGMR